MSFPYLSDLVHTVFGVNLPLPIPMFGLMVGIAFFVGLKVATPRSEAAAARAAREPHGQRRA